MSRVHLRVVAGCKRPDQEWLIDHRDAEFRQRVARIYVQKVTRAYGGGLR